MGYLIKPIHMSEEAQSKMREQTLKAVIEKMGTAPKHTCGCCGTEIYCVGNPAVCTVCNVRWEISEWHKPPVKGSERWLKYHPEKGG